MPEATIQLNASPLLSRLDAVVSAFENRQNPQLKAGMEAAGSVYLAFARRRFLENSSGGGTWPELAPSTIAGRLREPGMALGRNGKFSSPVPILIVTGKLLASLSQGDSAHYEQVDALTGRFGTANRIAGFHQYGGSRLPRRVVIPPPDADTVSGVRAALSKGISNLVASIAKG